MLKIVEITDKNEWDGFININGGHPLQLWGWGELKSNHNWQVKRIFVKNVSKEAPKHKKQQYSDVQAAAQILTRKLPWPLNSFAYSPRGPLILSEKAEERAKLLDKIAKYSKNHLHPRPVGLSIEPDWEDFPLVATEKGKWRRAKNTILIPQTLIIDLKQSDDEILAHMSKKTRQYIRKSADSVSVRELETAQELEQCLDIYEDTAKRAGFAIHDRQYYRDLTKLLGKNAPIFAAFAKIPNEVEAIDDENAVIDDQNSTENNLDNTNQTEKEVTVATEQISENQKIIKQVFGDKINYQEEMIAFLWPIVSDKTSFELYGGVNELGQRKRSNYILKWLTIKQLQSRGVERYDLNGLLNDGISNFKRGFAKHEDLLAGTYDYPFSFKYALWSKFLPLGKKVNHKIKR